MTLMADENGNKPELGPTRVSATRPGTLWWEPASPSTASGIPNPNRTTLAPGYVLECPNSQSAFFLCLLPGIGETMATSNDTVLQFAASSTASLTVKVHPLVFFNICDCYVRRPDQAGRVIGTLLGSVLPDGTVDVRNSYAVPHNEFSDQVALDIEYHHNMLVSHQKVNPKEVVVGWYSTGLGVTGGSALIHDFYSREVTSPVHLTVDTGFSSGEGTIKAYVSTNLSLGEQQLAAQFQEIPLDLRMVEAERVGFDILKTTSVDKIPNDLEGMETSMEHLLALIDDVYKYVDSVVEGHVTPDNNIGRFIADVVSSLPKLGPSAFDKLVNGSVQDQLLLLYLSSITRTQLSLAEKLNTAAQLI